MYSNSAEIGFILTGYNLVPVEMLWAQTDISTDLLLLSVIRQICEHQLNRK